MSINHRSLGWRVSTLACLLTINTLVTAQDSASPGVNATEILIGQTMPYSGPVSALSTGGRAHAALFAMVNERGGVNGRRIRLISLDDGFNPAKTVEHTRSLVEREDVLLIFGSLGTAPNLAIQKYLNARKVPHLFISTSSGRWDDPEHYPWTMTGIRPTFEREAYAYGEYILRTKPTAKIGVLYQNDDFGKDYLKGLHAALGARASTMIVAEQSYEVTDATVDSQIIALKGAGADTLITAAGPRFGAQAIRKVHDMGWRPLHMLSFATSGVKVALEPAGLDKCVGLISSAVSKDPTDPQWRNDPGMLRYLDWMKNYYPGGDPDDWSNVAGYLNAQLLVHVLTKAGTDLSRANILRQAASLSNVSLDMLLPGIPVETSSRDYLPVEHMQMVRFDGKRWVRFGDVLNTAPK